MLTIRKEQLAIFSKAELEKFVQQAIYHVKQFFPDQIQTLGEQKLDEFVRYSIKRAGIHKIAAANEVLKYIALAVLLGRDFDSDVELSWAGEILDTENSSATRVEMLVEGAKRKLKGT